MSKERILGRLRVQPGQSLFALNTKTGVITNLGKPKRIDVDNDTSTELL